MILSETLKLFFQQNRSDENDVITLTSGANRKTYWQFPKENWQACPAIRCNLKFESRSDAIEHFKLEHSKNSICCQLCDKPIFAAMIANFSMRKSIYFLLTLSCL